MVTEAEISDDDVMLVGSDEDDSVVIDSQEQDVDGEYELKKAEGEPLSVEEWKQRFLTNSIKDIRDSLLQIKPFKRCETTGNVIATQSLTNVFEGVCAYLNSGTKINEKHLISLTQELLSKCDLLCGIAGVLHKQTPTYSDENTWNNLYIFLKTCPHPQASVVPRLFKQKYHFLRSRSRSKLANAYEKLWLEFMRIKLPRKLLFRSLPYISNNVLKFLKEPHKTADFFFKVFDLGSTFSILALEAIFRLMVDHNFDYPDFYNKVYTLCVPSLFYTDQKKRFLELLDTFLSSSHVPLYIIAAFAKRLMQILLVAPLDAQEPVMGLVRNLITRHPGISTIIHRDIPESRQGDPYVNTANLSEANALDSSLWELRTLKRHWHTNVQKRARFADKGLQKIESFVRFRCPEEYFALMMSKKFGSESDSQEERYAKAQEESDDEDEPPMKKGKENKGRNAKRREEEEIRTIPVNFTAPNGKFLPENGFNFEYSDFYTV